MSPNVLAVYDVFAVAKKELHSNSSNRKNVAEKNTTKALAPTGVLRSPSRRKAASVYSFVIRRLSVSHN
jgi:hypothetical protein